LWRTHKNYALTTFAGDDLRNHLRSASEAEGKLISEEALEKFVGRMRAGHFGIKINRNFSISMMMSLSVEISNYLRQMDWMIIHAPSTISFVTCDAPFVLIPPKDHQYGGWAGAGIATLGSRKFIPLGAKLGLIALDRGDQVRHVDGVLQHIELLNASLANQTKRFLIAQDEANLRYVVAGTEIDQRERQPRMTTS
jgi:hypothetical protein